MTTQESYYSSEDVYNIIDDYEKHRMLEAIKSMFPNSVGNIKQARHRPSQ